MKMETIEDPVKLLQSGSQAAFSSIFEKYSDNVYFTAKYFNLSDSDAKEIVQDVFLKLWEKRSDLKNGTSIKSYLVTIAKNMIINRLKRKAHEVTCMHYLKKYKNHFENTTEDYIIYSDLENHTESFIDSMPDQRKQILMLKRKEGLSSKEIAEKLGVSKRTVENNIYKADKQLKTYLKKSLQSFLIVLLPFL